MIDGCAVCWKRLRRIYQQIYTLDAWNRYWPNRLIHTDLGVVGIERDDNRLGRCRLATEAHIIDKGSQTLS